MGLYLCVFESEADDVEIAGVEVGGYDDFGAFRVAVHENLEPGEWGSRYPALMNHEDASGTWTPADAAILEYELTEIRNSFSRLPAARLADGWQREVAATQGLRPASLHESFFDTDGAPLIDRLIDLAGVAVRTERPIWFQ